jgi:hypothetical protein
LDEDATVRAIERLMLTRTDAWMPTIGEIRREVVADGGDATGGAEMAWSEVQREVRRLGWNPGQIFAGGRWHEPERPVFSSPVTVAAVESLTWKAVCQGDSVQVREQFVWTWRHLAERALRAGAVDGKVALGAGATVPALGEGS